MTKEKYGHVVGYDTPELSEILEAAHLVPGSFSTYSKFFTEMLELCINFVYVMFASKQGGVEVDENTIAPTTEEQLRAVSKSYRMYSLVYPIFRFVSWFDALLFFTKGYAVVMEATPAAQGPEESERSTASA